MALHSFSHLRIGRMVCTEVIRRTGLIPNRLAFILGNIRPDLSIKYRLIGHTRAESYEFLIQEIRELSHTPVYFFTGFRYAMRLGIICHYLCDYFCYAHDEAYPGTLRDHLRYERQLRAYIRQHYGTLFVFNALETPPIHGDVEGLIRHLTSLHNGYLKSESHSMADDALRAISACLELVFNLLRFSKQAASEQPAFA